MCPRQNGGAERDRTDDLLNAIQALSQLSYSPTCLPLTRYARGYSEVPRAEAGAFYGSGLRWRNAQPQGRQTALRQRGVLALAIPPEARSAGLLGGEERPSAEAGGGEAWRARPC